MTQEINNGHSTMHPSYTLHYDKVHFKDISGINYCRFILLRIHRTEECLKQKKCSEESVHNDWSEFLITCFTEILRIFRNDTRRTLRSPCAVALCTSFEAA